MAIFVLLAFGIVLLILALIFRGKNIRGYHHIMQQNANVQPLLKERSAGVKHDHLLETLKNNPTALRELIDLQTRYADKLLNAGDYEAALDELALKYGK